MKRLLIRIGLTLISLVGVLAATLLFTLFFIVATESGTQFAWQRVHPLLPENITVYSLKGRLAGPLEVEGVKVKTKTFYLELDQIDISWISLQLLRGVLDIDSLAFTGVRYTELAPAPPKDEQKTTAPILPEKITLPLEVNLGKVSLSHFKFHSQNNSDPFVISYATITGVARKHSVNLSSFTIESPLFAVDGNTHLTINQDYPLKGELHWRIPLAEHPVANGHTVIDGNLRQLIITQSVEKPYDIEAEVHIKNPLDNFSFEVDLHANPLNLQSLQHNLPPTIVQLSLTGKGNPENMSFNLSGWAEDPKLGKFNATVDAGLISETLILNELTITQPGQSTRVTAEGQVEITDQRMLNVKVDWQQLQWPLSGDPLISSPIGTINLTGTPENLHADLDIAVGDRGTIKGRANRVDEVIDMALDWRDLQWPLQQPQIQSASGHVTVAGNINDYSLNLVAQITAPEQADANLLIKGKGNMEALDLSQVDIRAVDGKIEAKANLRWKPDQSGSIDLVGRGLNPGLLLQEWPGKLGVSLRAQGTIKNNIPTLQLHQLNAHGQLRGHELKLEAAGEYEESLIKLRRLALISGPTSLHATGTISDTLDVSWSVHSEDLGTLLPDATGRINGGGTLAGPVKRPRVITELTAEELAYSGYRVKSMNVDADVDVSGEMQSEVSLILEDGIAPGVEIKEIVLKGQGDADKHSLTMLADTDSGRADIAIEGKVHDPWQPKMSWDFRLGQANLKYPNLDSWELQAPVTGHITTGKAQLSKSCWRSNETLLCLEGKRSNEAIQADFELTDLPFSYFSHYLPPEIDLQGNLSGKGTFSQPTTKEPTINIDLNTTETLLLSKSPSKEEQHTSITFQPGEIHLRMQQTGLQAEMDLPLSDTEGVQLQATVSPGTDSLIERPLDGQITTEIENLDFIAGLIPEVQDLTGRLNGDMTLAGSLASPILQGRLALVEASAKLERPGLDLQDILVELKGEGDKGIRLKARARSEEGELQIDGTANLQGQTSRADITVKGENFRVMNTYQAQVNASPDLTIVLRDNIIEVGGEVQVPSARIKLKTVSDSAVKASDDQIIIGPDQSKVAQESPVRQMLSRVRVVLGDDVHFNGFGLKARIEGNVLAVDKPGEPTTGSGELMVLDGEYRAYGQGLQIEKGRILFAGGPIAQPGLDVRAVRRPAPDIVVGVDVRGNLRQPDFRVFSDPFMTQGNQLSYLVLGRPLSGTTGSEGSALSRAALALGLKGGNVVAEKIGSTLGLDQFGVGSKDAGTDINPEQASFVVGKYLSPKLYVSYGLGLFEPVSTLRLQYAISSRWELVTETSGEGSGGDLFYTIETGN